MTHPAPDSQWLRSIPSPALVEHLAAEQYGLLRPRAVLVRTFVNDVYRVEADGAAFALKVYRAGRWSADEVRWEQALGQHLVAAGIPLSAPVALDDGDTVGVVDAPEGSRPFALTEWVPGVPPRYPFSDELYATFGATLARFHSATVDFVTDLPRRPARAEGQVEQIVTALTRRPDLRALTDSPARADLVARSASAAEQQVARLAEQGLRRGICHGDASMDNLYLDADGIRLYDLDLAGPDWVVGDLVGALSTDHADAFLAAYTAERELHPAELEALPWLRILNVIENLHFHLVRKPAGFGTATVGEGWADDAFDALADTARSVGITASG